MIQVSGLTKRFGAVLALDGVSFEVARGELVGFLGPNGAGKTTALRIAAGVLHPDAGSVRIDGRDLAREPVAARARVGYLPETAPLYPDMRVDAYLDFAARVRGLRRPERRRAVERAVEAADLAGATRRRIGELSKGWRQRVGLAQALLGDPPVLVLDEPTSGLDPVEIGRIRELARRLAERAAVLLSTHVLSEVEETARRVVMLAGGRVVADGSPLELACAEGTELLVTLRAAPPEALEALAGLERVRAARRAGADGAGRERFALDVAERFAAAEEVHRLVGERGWTLLELRHETPRLESVFLRRAAAAHASAGDGAGAG